jgi:V8-like Glu-specific endopeptidase
MKFFAAALGLAAIGCAPNSPVGVEHAPIIGGTDDTADPSVVLVEIGGSTGGSLCTGEVVSPHVVITAAHCVSPGTVGAASWMIFSGQSIFFGGGSLYPATEGHAHPMFNDANPGEGYDIGVVIMKDALPLAPLPMNRTALDVTNVGQAVRFVGYGLASTADQTSAGVKRTTNSTLDDIVGNLLEFNDASHGTCEGDSGGPAFMKLDGTNEVIVGVTSFGTHTDCSPPGFDTAVDAYAASFVDPFILQFDPPPPPDMSPLPPGPDGFPPGAVGSTCGDQAPCDPGNVCAPAPLGYCTAGCDPSQAGSCPMGTHCANVDGQTICLRGAGGGSGCAMAGVSPLPLALLFALALAAVIARRRARQ